MEDTSTTTSLVIKAIGFFSIIIFCLYCGDEMVDTTYVTISDTFEDGLEYS
jgi:hypothetical protein